MYACRWYAYSIEDVDIEGKYAKSYLLFLMVGFFLCVCKITICLPSHTPTLYVLPLGFWGMLPTNWYISGWNK